MERYNLTESCSKSESPATRQLRNPKALKMNIKTEEIEVVASSKKTICQTKTTWSNQKALEGNSNELRSLPSDKTSICCRLCSREFSTPSNLKQHLQIHEKKDKRLIHNCHLCDKSYFYKCSLNKHIKMHGSGVPMKDDDSFTTASAVSDETLEAKSPKKVKVEEGTFSNALQPVSFKETIIAALQNTPSTSLDQSISFTFLQALIGGGHQNIKITIDPMEVLGNHLTNERDNLDDYFVSSDSNKKTLQVKEEYDFLENIFNTSDQVPVVDYGFHLENI